MHQLILELRQLQLYMVKHNMVLLLERSMNRQNKRHCDNKSGIKGITKASKTTWKAQIVVNGKNIHLGHYPTQSQAADAYWEVAKLHFGEFAKFE